MLKSARWEAPKGIFFSPAQRWLLAISPSTLHIYECGAMWHLVQALPALADPDAMESARWHCAAFTPCAAEVDHQKGLVGQDNHLAVLSSHYLCVLDYSGGWGSDVPKRTRSLLGGTTRALPTGAAYTSDGVYLVAGFDDGQIQIWNAFSVTLEKSLGGHKGYISRIAASPRCAPYPPRFVSCGVD